MTMKKLRAFFYTLSKSASEPAYYFDILKTKFAFSFKFYIILLLLLSIVDVVLFRLRDVPQLLTTIESESGHMVNQLPGTLRLSYTQGTLTPTGITLPFTIYSSEALQKYSIPKSLLSLSKDELPVANTLVTLTPTRALIQSDGGQTEYKTIFESESWSLTKNQLEEKRKEFMTLLPTLANFMTVAAVPFWFIGLLVGTTFTLFFLTIITNSFGWIIGIRISLVKTLQLGMHAIGIATLIDVIKFALLPTTDVSLVIPGYLGIMTLALWSLRKRKMTEDKMNS